MAAQATAEQRAHPAEQEVTALELFFDLVFVFAFTQVTGFLVHRASWARLAEAIAILMVLWFAWSAYAWLANNTRADEGPVRVVLLAAMAPMLIVSLAVPHAFGRDALVFGVAFFAVRALHIVAYTVVSREDPELRGVVLRLARSIMPAAGILVVAGVLPGTGRILCWVAALVVDYGGILLSGTDGWRVGAAHFAERHRLIVIIALGESVVATGVAAGTLGVGVVTGALLGVVVSAALWWAYFDVVALVAERRLAAVDPRERARMARDSFTYLHLPMVTGIVVFAFGVKKTLAHVHAHLDAVPAVALCGGIALYLVALSLFKRRNVGSLNLPRLVAAAILAALAPGALRLPALASLALVALVTVGLVVFEFVRYHDARTRIRTAASAQHI